MGERAAINETILARITTQHDHRLLDLETQEVNTPGVAVVHNFLSATHPDTDVAAAARGYIIRGNATPHWERYAHPGKADHILTTDATDVLWSGYTLSGTAGQAYVLSATGGTVPTGSGVANQVTYWATASTLGGDAGLTVDAANDMFVVADAGGIGNSAATARLMFNSAGATDYAYFSGCNVGIGIVAPVQPLHVYRSINDDVLMRVDNPNVGNLARAGMQFRNGAATSESFMLVICGTGYNAVASWRDGGVMFSASNLSGGFHYAAYAGGIHFETGGYGVPYERMTIDNSGLVGVGITTPAVCLHTVSTTITTNAVLEVARIEARVSTAVTGFAAGGGAGIALYAESATDASYRHAGDFQAQWKDATDATRTSQLRLWAERAGTACPVGIIVAPNSVPTVPAFSAWGYGAVDFQTYRSNAAQVASGEFAVICGGYENTASGASAIVIGGNGNTASGDNSIIIGGRLAVASGAGSYATGDGATADKICQRAFSNGTIDTAGDVQDSDLHLGRDIATHVDTTWYTLYTDNGAALATIASDTCWHFIAHIVGLTAGAPQRWDYQVEGTIVNDGGTTTLLTQTVTTWYETDAAYDAQAAADDANDALLIQVRRNGGTDYSVKWSAWIKLVEVTHA